MSTVRQVVDTVYRDWLRSGDDMPVATRLTSAVDAATTTLAVDLDMLLPEEADLFAVGVLVEVGREQVLVRDVVGGTLTVMRGANGTSAAAHPVATLVYPQPRYARETVYQAVCDAVVGLWPDLYQVLSRAVTIGTAYTEVPSNAQMIIDVRWAEGSSWFTTSGILALGFSSVPSRAAMFTAVPTGRAATVTFRGSFLRPESESDDLDTLGVRREWERIVALEAAASVVAGGPELDPLTHEFVAEQLARETFPPGSAGSIAERLRGIATELRAQASRQLRASYAHPVAFMPGSGV